MEVPGFQYDEVDYIVDDDDGASLVDSSDSDLCEEDCRVCTENEESDLSALPTETSDMINRENQLKIIYMKKFIDSINQDLHEKKLLADKGEDIKGDWFITRDELRKCQERILELEKERDNLYAHIAHADQQQDIPNGDRLRAQHERCISELDMERGIESSINNRLADAEYNLAKAELEKGKYELSEDDLLNQQVLLKDQKYLEFEARRKKDEAYVHATRKRQERAISEAKNLSREMVRREKQALSEAQKAKEVTNRYLQKTMQEVRDENKRETERNSADYNRRINAVLSLKKNITTNKDNINALRARNKDIQRGIEKEDQAYKDDVLAQGGDPETALLVKKRIESMEQAKVEHAKKTREAETQIAAKLLLEEERFNKRKEMYPHLWNEKQWEQSKRVKAHKKKKLRSLQVDDEYDDYVARLDTMPTAAEELNHARFDDSDDDNPAMVSARGIKEPSSIASTTNNLAKPEFAGMWNQFEKYVVPKDVVVDIIKGQKISKMEQDIMRDKLQKQRENIVQTQVAAGREFKGKSSFNSKPEIVHFKDFDVGKTYKKKVTLTNVSYSINFCKLLGLSDHLKDFIEIVFNPPGQLSAGMTCELVITFKPMINEDLEGDINFLSQTGPFWLPIKCTTKKCDLSVDMTEVQFGTSVIGETLRKHITLTNHGALGTRLMFGKYTGKDHHIITAKSPGFEQQIGANSMKDSAENIIVMETPTSELGESPALPAGSAGGLSKPHTPASAGPLGPASEEGNSQQTQGSMGAESSCGADLSEVGDLDYDGMMVSENNSVYIGPFSEEKLEIVWKPTVPGKCDAQYILSFEDEGSKDITITSSGTAIDVPVYVTRQNIDLQICMLDRLYQDSIVATNRATSALKLTFEVPKELRKHMELLPRTGFVQAQSSFSAQLKFLPRASLAEDAPQYFDKETGVLEVPLTIHVADQTRPVPFVVHAIVTNSDLQFNVEEIDFGHCTIYESVKSTVQLTNKSILPQEFGFLGLPDYVDIQPNDGFGILLPEETIKLDVIFSPPKAKNYGFELCCKSIISREFRIKCKGVGVHPPMELSKQVIHFKATSLNDWSLQDVYLVNNHLSTNEYTHPVPRIGRGPIAPVSPTSYEFKVPEGCPLTIYPAVGTVKPGEKQRILCHLAPKLPVERIKQEAVRVAVRKAEEKAQKEFDERVKKEKEEAETQANKKKPAGKPSGKASPKAKGRPGTGQEIDYGKPEPVTAPAPESIQVESDEYSSAHSTLLRQFEGDFQTYVIPCYLASAPCGKPGELQYSIHNTLYLEVHCPTVKPDVVVISDNGRTTINYGDVSIGQLSNKTVTIQNISDKEIPLTGSLLDTTGPFEMRNPLRELPPDASHSLIIRFAPLRSDVFQETLHIYAPDSTLHVNLLGRGVSPTIELNLEHEVFDMGAVLVNEYIEKTFKIRNTSSLSVDYMIKFDSLSQRRYDTMQALPEFVRSDGKKPHLIGVQNNNGKCVFDCVPYAGTIAGGGNQEITLTFAPDHASDYFSDGIHVELFNMEEAYSFQVVGQAKEHIMYVTGGQLLQPNVESLLPMVTVEPDEDAKPIAGNILMMFYSVAKDGVFSTATSDLTIGCVRTMAVSQKKNKDPNKKSKGKNGEYAFENLNLIAAKGFTIAEPKAYLEAGTKKAVTISWTPPETHNPDEPVEASIIVTTKCELAENYQISLRGLIVSQPPAEMVIEDLEEPPNTTQTLPGVES